MIHANELKTGSLYLINNAPYIVEQVFKQSPSARGSATLYKIRARNLLTKVKIDQTLKGDDAFQEPNFSKRAIQFLYRNGTSFEFMDTGNFEQYTMQEDELTEESNYLIDGLEGIFGMFLDERLIGIELPASVTLTITECDPSIKGASATARTKTAKVETGLVLQVPEYIENGTVIRVDTRTGKFQGRA